MEMASERSPHSVLAKLMRIDRLSPPHTSNGRQRVLSENYRQSIASVARRERSPLDLDVEDFSMDVDGHLESEATVELSAGRVNRYGTNSSVRNKLKKSRISPQNQTFELFGGFDLRGSTNSCSRLDYSTVPGSSGASANRKLELCKAQVQQEKSLVHIKTGCSTPNKWKHWVEVENGCYSPSKRSVGLKKRSEKPHLPGNSFSSPGSLYGGKEEISAYCLRSKGPSSRRRRAKSSGNDIKSPTPGSLPCQEIARQITSQVKNSVWHSYTGVSRSGSRSEKCSADEHEETTPSASFLFDTENKHEESSFKSSTESSSEETLKNKKEFLDKWRTRQRSQEMKTSHGREAWNFGTLSTRGNVNGWEIRSARYLSKPTLFPSAWVPRSIKREFILDRSWTLRREAKGSMLRKDLMMNKFGHEDLRSTSEPSGPTLDSEKCYFNQEACSNTKGPGMFEDPTVFEEIYTPRESFSDRSSFSDVEIYTPRESFSDRSSFSDIEGLTYHEARLIQNNTGDRHMEEQVSEEDYVVPLSLDGSFASVNMDSEQVIDDENVTSIKLQREQLSAEPSTCILEEDRGLNYQLKDDAAFAPRSPVSSLEGPEACIHHPNSTVVSDEISYFPGCLHNDAQGLQAEIQLMEVVSLDSGSEGPGMKVSSAGGDEGISVGCYWEDAQIMEIYGSSANRDFAYLVDVLAESGFPIGLEMERETWRSQNFVLNPSVFELLEEKYRKIYGKQTNCERSERRLLFDRINSKLMEVAQPVVGINAWRKPVAKRFGVRQGQDTIENEVWGALVNEEEEVKWELCDKLCRREIEWLELEEDSDFIVQEIEFSLIDELIEEFVKMETSQGVFM